MRPVGVGPILASSATFRDFGDDASAPTVVRRARGVQPIGGAPTLQPVAEPSPLVADDTAWERSSYRPSRGPRGVSAVAALLVVAGSLAALIALNGVVQNRPEAHRTQIVTMQLTPPPPARPPATTRPPHALTKPQPQQVVVPTPMLDVAKPKLEAAAAPLPQLAPAPPVRVTAPAAPSAGPVAAPAPPAVADGGNLSARLISAKPPTYPIESRHRHEEGIVVLGVLVSVDGSVGDISVVQSSGSARLDQAALGAVRKWRWATLTRDGQPVMVRGQVKIPFVLQH